MGRSVSFRNKTSSFLSKKREVHFHLDIERKSETVMCRGNKEKRSSLLAVTALSMGANLPIITFYYIIDKLLAICTAKPCPSNDILFHIIYIVVFSRLFLCICIRIAQGQMTYALVFTVNAE